MIDTLPQALDTLDSIIEYAHTAGDPIGYFTVVYRAVTQAEHQHLHEFTDPARMERFAILFADRFIGAFVAHVGGREQLGWEGVFDPDLSVLESVVLPINSHVLWDLGHTLAEMGDLPSLKADFAHVEKVARPVFEASWDALTLIAPRARWLRRLTPTQLWPGLLAYFRGKAWKFGTALLTHPQFTEQLCADQLAYTRTIDRRWRRVLAPLAAGECRDVTANLRVFRGVL